jgi:hypothetical protein
MYKEILQSIAGVEVFPVISLVLFVAVFTIVLIRVLRADRAELQRQAALPLEEPRRPA